jgi:hypothetical protein
MISNKVLCSIREARVELIKIIQQEFSVSSEAAAKIFDEKIQPHLEQLRENIFLLIEYPYADHMYRDTYYAYHAMKLHPYKKDCIRISLFVSKITHDEFRDIKKTSSLQDRYLGFLILRPTIPHVVGLNVISPTALRRHDFVSINTKITTTIDGTKLFVHGFPHASQDGETMTCAEVTIWCLLEYFCWSSTIYRRVMPSEILQLVQQKIEVRTLPSVGLDTNTSVYILKASGLATNIYYNDEENEFRQLLSCYISSGLPVILNLKNNNHEDLAHAILAVGHSITTHQQIDQLQVSTEKDTQLQYQLNAKQIRIFDNDDLNRDIIMIDDNFPVYQSGTFKRPTRYYRSKQWADHAIECCIVPLHTDIRMDVIIAKRYIKEMILHAALEIPGNTDVFIRTFLTSCQAYKEYVLKDADMTPAVRDEILNLVMGEYIWVGEISTKQLIKQRKAQGIVILDATEPNTEYYRAIIFAAYGDAYHIPHPVHRELEEERIPIGHFKIFINNLNKF